MRHLTLIALLIVAGSIGYGIAASPAVRPVVRQEFVRYLDPEMPDFSVPATSTEAIVSDPTWKTVNLSIAGDLWMEPTFDDSGWLDATSLYTSDGLVSTIDEPDHGVHAIWHGQTGGGTGDHDAAFRKRFHSFGGIGHLSITCDNDFRVWIDGVFLGGDKDQDWTTREVFEVNLDPGEHVLSVEGIDYDGGTIGMACALFVGPQQLEGSRWAIFDVPNLSPDDIVTTRLHRLVDVPVADEISDLAGMKEISEPNVPIFGRPGRIFVPLFPGYGQSFDPIHQGTYRLIVDSVE